MTEPERTVLLSDARVVLDDRSGPVASQADAVAAPRALPARRAMPAPALRFAENPALPRRFDVQHRVRRLRRQRSRKLRRASATGAAGAVVERRRQPARLSRHRIRCGIRVGGQQPVESPDAVEQRSRLRSARRGRSTSTTTKPAIVWCPTPLPMPCGARPASGTARATRAFERERRAWMQELTRLRTRGGAGQDVDPAKLQEHRPKVRRLEDRLLRRMGARHDARVTRRRTSSPRSIPRPGPCSLAIAFHPDFAESCRLRRCDLRPRTRDRATAPSSSAATAASPSPASFGRVALSGQSGPGSIRARRSVRDIRSARRGRGRSSSSSARPPMRDRRRELIRDTTQAGAGRRPHEHGASSGGTGSCAPCRCRRPTRRWIF